MNEKLLSRLLWLIVGLRFFYPHVNTPMAHMVGMSKRQWRQAGQFSEPGVMGGIDSFLYQAWLAFVRFISQDIVWIVHSFSGLLCAALPIAWYLCARELLPRKWALGTALIIALTPSFLTIYAYFASETLLLPLLGLACWQSVRCYKSPSHRHLILAGVFWTLAAYTRVVALPPAIACLGILWWISGRPFKPLAAIATCFVLIGTASAIHSHHAVNIYAPFGAPQLNSILARTHAQKVYYYFDDQRRWFRSPSASEQPLAPLSDWGMRNMNPPITVRLHTKDGADMWDSVLQQYPLTRERIMRQLSYNSIFFLFGPSWPEVWPDSWTSDGQRYYIEDRINYWFRWVWAPLILYVFLGRARYGGDMPSRALITLSLAMVVMLMLQFTAVFEGRYRKPVEPFLILSAALIAYDRKQKREEK